MLKYWNCFASVTYTAATAVLAVDAILVTQNVTLAPSDCLFLRAVFILPALSPFNGMHRHSKKHFFSSLWNDKNDLKVYECVFV